MDNKDKIIALYKYIKDLASLKMRIVTDIDKQTWSCALGDIPVDPDNVSIYYRDRVENEDTTQNDELIKVHKPEFQACPQPDKVFINWLEEGWDKFQNDVKIKESIVEIFDSSTKDIERFEDSKSRVEAFEKWQDLRNKWVEKQRIIYKTRRFFTRLYQLHTDLERDSETSELMIGDGILKDSKNNNINHPVLLRRVKTSFDARSNTIYICDTDTDSELYTILFQEMSDINHSAIKSLKEELQENDYHPLDRNDSYDFLKILVHRLSPESKFTEKAEDRFFSNGDRLLMYTNPVFFVRKRIDGALKAIEQIIENIEATGYIPPHLIDIVDGGVVEIPEEIHEPTIEEQLATIGGEDIEILLSKETNKEQLEIAQRIERYNAVLVQGPPGTGKTHTIANLLGHFLAQGKSVLVTSHTKKALTVLKDKVVQGIQDLCVAVLDDTNIDMERSVDGISDYLSRYTSNELKKKIDVATRQRLEIINSLSDVRKKLFTLKFKEFKPIVVNGESISPSEAARYVNEYAEKLSYIPGKVTLYHTLPLTFEELARLYRSNVGMTSDEEQELNRNLPNPGDLLTPSDFKNYTNEIYNASDKLTKFKDIGLKTEININKDTIHINSNQHEIDIIKPSSQAVQKLKEYISTFKKIEGWMIYAAVDGKKGGAYKSRWNLLTEQIENARSYAESLIEEQLGKNIVFSGNDIETLTPIFIKMKEILDKKDKISKIDRLLNKSFEIAERGVSISGKPISCANDCTIVLNQIQLIGKRRQCALLWDSLLSVHGVPAFNDLDNFAPEDIAVNWIGEIKRYLSWYESEYKTLCSLLDLIIINSKSIFETNSLDSEVVATQKILSAIEKKIPDIINICEQYFIIRTNESKLQDCLATILEGDRKYSASCNKIAESISNKDYTEYESAYLSLADLYDKYSLQQLRIEYLNRLYVNAPEWAEAIKEREGIHGLANVPIDIEDAWKWKQFAGIISSITAEPYEELQAKSVSLSKSYRERTATLAELNAWYNLLLKTERNLDMKQALQGWKLTIRKIGKGTGKNAPILKAEARKLMAKCQTAVPAWIMPVNKALESLDPRQNQFDVIIIDEASQSDISALSIVYMAKKIIIVGDDKQVSPMAVGVDIERMNNLVEMYIKNIIPNWHLFNATSSLYDIAGTTFQPLMLREHFRCVPDIIGFSNKLSYDFRIKPLRDTSNCNILPAVVNYRVDAGERDPNKKTNLTEAQTIVALMLSCMEQPEYEGKTFGVISLLGDEQAVLVQNMLIEYLEPAVIDMRRILCGNASHFQGDERDVIFLSLVDSNSEDGPLRLMGTGVDDSNKKRYNVAASRAKDQLWVVSSLDTSKDLKSGDLRKELLDYASNPKYFTEIAASIEKLSESPFEEAVGKALVSKGYHVVQQWLVGAYRIDMVIVYGNKKIAVECDGERFHSGENKIREDMERQTILERLGWNFIRIRGSEFYRDPDKTLDRVLAEIEKYGICPEKVEVASNETSSELIERIKIRAGQLFDEWKDSGNLHNETSLTVEFALSNKMADEGCKNNNRIQSVEINLEKTSYKPSVDTKDKRIKAEKKRKVEQFEQLTLLGTESQGTRKNKVPEKKVKALTNSKNNNIPNIFKYLDELGVEYIDNSERSSIIWVVNNPELNKEFANNVKIKFDANCQYEGRGSRATNNRPAWRINV